MDVPNQLKYTKEQFYKIVHTHKTLKPSLIKYHKNYQRINKIMGNLDKNSVNYVYFD